MKITITIDCDNAAFEDNPEYEAGRIIEELGSKIRRGYMNFTYYLQGNEAALRDINGNKVGKMEVED